MEIGLVCTMMTALRLMTTEICIQHLCMVCRNQCVRKKTLTFKVLPLLKHIMSVCLSVC